MILETLRVSYSLIKGASLFTCEIIQKFSRITVVVLEIIYYLKLLFIFKIYVIERFLGSTLDPKREETSMLRLLITLLIEK